MTPRWQIKSLSVTSDPITAGLSQETDVPLGDDAAVARATFYGVAGLKSLANHRLRLYHTHNVWYRGVDESLIEYGKALE